MAKNPTVSERAADYVAGVTTALKIGEDLGFTLAERARLMGYMQVVGDNPVYLDHQLKLMDGKNAKHVAERVAVIIAIMASVEALFGNKVAEMKRWLDVKHHESEGESVKSLMVSGDMAKLREALIVLARATATD